MAVKGERKSTNSDEIIIDRARYNQITLYEVSEDELTIIEKGSPSSNFLNFGIAFLSLSGSGLITLTTAQIPDTRVFIVYVVLTAVLAAAGVVMMVLWRIYSKNTSDVFRKIRSRKSPEALRTKSEVDTSS